LGFVHRSRAIFRRRAPTPNVCIAVRRVQACEPFVLVVTSALILGTRPSWLLVASLLPVVVGVSVASATELCFNWLGFASAMASNVSSPIGILRPH
jgi:hypothetical protein